MFLRNMTLGIVVLMATTEGTNRLKGDEQIPFKFTKSFADEHDNQQIYIDVFQFMIYEDKRSGVTRNRLGNTKEGSISIAGSRGNVARR